MPNGVKYSTTTLTGALKRGNIALGVTGELGPTANTGFYSMPVPASGKYIINKVSPSSIPNFFAPQNDAELIRFARNEGATGADTGSSSAILAWIATQPNLEATNFEYENIVTNGLVLNLDAGFVSSYPTAGTTWYDLSGNDSNGTLTNGPTFNSANSGSIVFDGTNDYISLSSQTAIFSNSSFTISLWMYPQDPQDNMMIFATYGPGPNFNNKAVVIRLQPDNVVLFAFYNDDLSSTGTFTYNVWQNLVCTYNYATDTSSIYINGNLIGTGANGPCTETGVMTMRIGNWFNQEFYLGNISLFSLYNRSLSQTEITQNFNAQKGRFGL